MGGAAGHGAAVAAAIAGHRREEAAAEAAEEAAGKGAAGVPDASAPPAEVTSASGGSRDVPPAGWFPAAPAPPPLLQRLCCVCCPTTGQPHAGGELRAMVWCGAHRPHFAWPERRAGAPAAAARAFAARGVNGGLQGPKGAVCLAGGGVRACTVGTSHRATASTWYIFRAGDAMAPHGLCLILALKATGQIGHAVIPRPKP